MQQARRVAALLICASLGACASAGGQRTVAQANPNDDYDAGKVATVTQWAQAHGATVVWIHYPTKARTAGDGD
jgi:hypothetical protein